jgi:hypothetical protein
MLININVNVIVDMKTEQQNVIICLLNHVLTIRIKILIQLHIQWYISYHVLAVIDIVTIVICCVFCNKRASLHQQYSNMCICDCRHIIREYKKNDADPHVVGVYNLEGRLHLPSVKKNCINNFKY